MRKKILALLLSVILCLVLTACGDSEAPEETSSTESATNVSNGNLKPESVVISVGKSTVTYSEFLAYSYFMKSPYDGIIGDEGWNYNKIAEDGKTIGQEAVEAVLRLIIQVKVICKEAAIQKVTLGTDEKEQASYNAKTFCDGLDEKIKAANGLNVKTVTNMFEENKLAQKMYNIELGKVNANLTVDQINAARVQLIYCKANEQNRNQVKAKMDQIYQSVTTEKKNFYATAKANSEAKDIEYLIGQSDTRKNLANAVVGMKAGQISNIISEQDGFYIAYCVESNSKSLQDEYKNQLILEKQTQAFQSAYKKWTENFDVRVSKSLLKKS